MVGPQKQLKLSHTIIVANFRSINTQQKVETPKPVWDYGFDNVSGDLIVLLFSNQDYLKRFKVSSDGFTEIPVHSSDQSKSELDRFFEGTFIFLLF